MARMKYLLLCLLSFVLLSCSSKKTQEESPQSWKEFETFQGLIQKPFQHLKDPAAMDSLTLNTTVENIKPIAEAAEKLADSSLPDKMNNETIKSYLQKMKTESRALAGEIAEGTEDDVIGTKIYSIYSTFVDVKTAWERKE